MRKRALTEAYAEAKRRAEAKVIYNAFKAKYRYDPAGFVSDCVKFNDDEGAEEYQLESMRFVVEKRRHSDRGPHGTGKTAISSWLVLWFALTRDGEDWKVLTTASAWRQLTHFLWPEIRKWARRLDWERIGRDPFDERHELLNLQLSLETGQAFALASSDHTLIEGAHADQLLYIFDESKSIPAPIFDAAEGAFSGAWGDSSREAYAYAVSTPGEMEGRFYEIQSHRPGYEDWSARKISIERVVATGRIAKEWVENRRKQWGAKSQNYINRVLADFSPKSSDKYVIPLSWVELAQQRWLDRVESGFVPEKSDLVAGVDVGGQVDLNTIAELYKDFLAGIQIHPKDDPMELTGKVIRTIEPSDAPAVVDANNKGAGVYSRLDEQGFKVYAFQAGETTDTQDVSGLLKFANKRAAAWWALRDALNPEFNPTFCIPPDDVISEEYSLSGELTTPEYKTRSNGAIVIQSKEEIKDKLGKDKGRSTDLADSVIMANFLPVLILEDEGSTPEYNSVTVRRKAKDVLSY